MNIQGWFSLGWTGLISLQSKGLDEAQAWIKIAGRNINNSDMQMIPPLWQKVKKN